jgi:hypothetical protein
MRNHFLQTIAMIAALVVLSAVSGRAQAGSNFTVNVPFDFIASGKTFPAGEYVMGRSTQGSEGLMIRARSGNGGAYLLTKTIQTEDNQQQTRVVFNRYNNTYFLSQIWVSGKRTGRELFKTRTERGLEQQLAQRAVKPETIAIAGKAH